MNFDWWLLRRWFADRAELVAENDRLRQRCAVAEHQLRYYDMKVAAMSVELNRLRRPERDWWA